MKVRLRREARRLRGIAACMAALALTACGASNFNYPAAQGNEALYEALYPYYFEYCAGSSIDKKPGFGTEDEGGPGGHVVFYLNRACRDPSTDYPTLRMCDTLPAGVAQGAGISMDAHFRNANWVVTPGRDFLLYGGLSPGMPFTHAAYQRVQWEAEGMRLLDGVEFHPDVFDDKPAGMSRRDFKYNVSIGSVYGVGLGRGLYCARVPLTRAQMARMVAFLNALNAQYRSGKKEFDGSVVENNCVHPAHNALASADLWDYWPTDRFPLIAVFDFPVPKNDFVNLIRRTNDMDLSDLSAIYDDAPARRELMAFGRLPTEPGSLARSHPPQAPNTVYNTDVSLIFFDEPTFGPYNGWFKKIFSEPRYYDIETNLLWFRDLYARLEAERKPLSWWLRRRGERSPAAQKDFAAFYARFYEHLAEDRADVDAKLAQLKFGRMRETSAESSVPSG